MEDDTKSQITEKDKSFIERKEIAKRLRIARAEAGYKSMDGFAKQNDIKPATYISHERAIRGIPLAVLKNYSDLLEVNYQWLHEGTGVKFNSSFMLDEEMLAFAMKNIDEMLERWQLEVDHKTKAMLVSRFFTYMIENREQGKHDMPARDLQDLLIREMVLDNPSIMEAAND